MLPSEGGHGNLAASDPLELEVLGLLMRRFDFVSWETVLSGPGLVNLYQAVCEVWGCAAEVDDPAAISARALTVADPVCHQTLEMFCNLLGTAAGTLAVTVCATGGVYLAGGILPRLHEFLAASQFRRRFDARGQSTRLRQSDSDAAGRGCGGGTVRRRRRIRRRTLRPHAGRTGTHGER